MRGEHFDPFDLRDPFPAYQRMRAEAPVFYDETIGYWIVGIACDWFKRTPSSQVTDLTDQVLGELHTEAGLRIARQDLAYSRRLLQIGLL